MQKLAVNALGDTVVAHDDVLFGAGDSAEAAYFVQSGRLNYHWGEEDDSDGGIPVSRNVWIAEMALWTPWTHLGDLVSEDVSRLVVLHVEQFCKCVRESGECQPAAVAYAKDYVDELKSRNSNMNDLFISRRDKQPARVSRQASMHSAMADGSFGCCRGFWRTPKTKTNVLPMDG